MQKIEEKKGITLIALVITIIILIILAGISISMIIGEGGLIQKAEQAKTDTINAQAESDEKLNVLEKEINKVIHGEDMPVQKTTIEELKNKGVFVEDNTEVVDNKGNKVVIPNGFKIAEDSGINVVEGIVIEDNDPTTDGNGNRRGNQFVWIPVSNLNQDGSNKLINADDAEVEVTLGRYTFGADGTENLIQSAENYIDETSIEPYYKELAIARISNGSLGLNGTNTTAKNLKGFIDSVKVNAGYYIARYEASYRDGTKPYSKVSVTATTSSTQTDGKLWNNLTQGKAAEASRAMYANPNFETDLINSYAWDTAISYIQKCSGDTDYSVQNSLNASIANTGKNGDEVCKINDMASNLREWTTEYCMYTNSANETYPCTYRGGYYIDAPHYASDRNGIHANSVFNILSFRIVLYI